MRRQRRDEAQGAEDRRLDDLDAQIFEAHEVTLRADMLGHRLAYGLVDLDECRQFLADTDTSDNPYIDLSFLEHAYLMAEGHADLAGVRKP